MTLLIVGLLVGAVAVSVGTMEQKVCSAAAANQPKDCRNRAGHLYQSTYLTDDGLTATGEVVGTTTDVLKWAVST
ncbi:hypothetical protein [Arthrobacter globiformis]|uniref:hypothetical protein n=1 Tax=Arthrobacter globiformis TaxID=1665 RepID=UPI0027D8665B|nr:hypothetical protein [Arthrobacter globiformis]